MRLADLRRLAIRKQSKIRFRLRNGMECVISERGVALVPGLDRVPDFNLEQELDFAPEFVLESALGSQRAPQRISRDELAAMAAPPRAAGAAHEEE